MVQYRLTIEIEKNDANILNSNNFYVALLQVVPQGQSQVVAVLATPQNTTTITWDDDVYAYVSGYRVANFKTLKINSYRKSVAGSLYSFDGQFINYASAGLPGYVQIANKNLIASGPVTVGLAAQFSVNMAIQPLSILTAQRVCHNGMATIPVCLGYDLTLISSSEVGTVIPSGAIPDGIVSLAPLFTAQPALRLDFSVNQSQIASYNATQNCFVATQ